MLTRPFICQHPSIQIRVWSVSIIVWVVIEIQQASHQFRISCVDPRNGSLKF